MDTRIATIFPLKTYSANFTEILDLNISDPISQILVMFAINSIVAGTDDAHGHPAAGVSNIELVDGSDVLFSLNGQEAQGVDFYVNRRERPNVIDWTTGSYSRMMMVLNFGRSLFDTELALDPKQFGNLQLKITSAMASGGDNATGMYLQVLAQIFDEKTISPVGFLMTKEIKKYTLVNASYEYTKLPTDYPYKQIFLRCQRGGTAPVEQISTVKLSEDNDKRIPVDLNLTYFIENCLGEWPIYKETMVAPGTTTAVKKFCTPTWHTKLQSTQWRTAVVTGEVSTYSEDGGRFTLKSNHASANHQLFVQGLLPHAVFPLLPDFGDDIAGWWDVSGLGSLRADILAGGSVGTSQTAEIITQQLRRY